MEENRDYHAYRYGDHLTPGSELKIEHSVVCENVDISTLITMGTDSLEAMRQGSIDGEQKAYEIVVAAAKQWEQQAAATQTINRALEYLRTPEIEHTGNQWKDTDNWRADQKISNRVYQMTCSIWEDTKYDRETKQSVPIAWYVTWEVRIHSPKQGYGAKIAGQNQKRYTDKNAAIKYLDGRKKAYSHLFTEISPPIPKEYEHHFMVHGTLLPGYTVEGLEQAKTGTCRRRGFGGRYFYTQKPGEAFRPGEALCGKNSGKNANRSRYGNEKEGGYTIMKVLMVEPGKSPYAAEIESGLKSLQAAVGGDIQAVYPYEDPVALICNEEGKLMGLPLNRALFDDDGHIYDIVSGNFLIVGLGEEDFTDLSPDLMEKYGEQFKYHEKFARIAGEIIAVKQPATNEHREKPMMHHSGPDL